MWFVYRKSPLGTVVKENMKASLGLFKGNDVLKAVKTLKEILVAEVKIIPINDKSLSSSLALIDPDLIDVVKNSKCDVNECYIIIVSWYGE
jgi:hypothetical protein